MFSVGHGCSQIDQGRRHRSACGRTNPAGRSSAAGGRTTASGDSGAARRGRPAEGIAAAADDSVEHVEGSAPRSIAQEEAAGQAARFGQAAPDGRVDASRDPPGALGGAARGHPAKRLLGPGLRSDVLYQHHQNGVTQPLLHEALLDRGSDHGPPGKSAATNRGGSSPKRPGSPRWCTTRCTSASR